jgi:hypothetical protein
MIEGIFIGLGVRGLELDKMSQALATIPTFRSAAWLSWRGGLDVPRPSGEDNTEAELMTGIARLGLGLGAKLARGSRGVVLG